MSREQDRLFIRNFMAVLAALVGVTLVLIIAVNIAFDQSQEGPTAVERERAAQRLQPVGQVRVAPAQTQPPAAPDAGTAPPGEPAAQPPSPEQTATPAQSGAATARAPAAGAGAAPSGDTAAGANGDTTATTAEPEPPAGEGAAAAQQAPPEATPAAAPAEDLAAGQALAEGMCNVCHANQFLNSPQLGDRTAWKPRLQRDLPTMVRHVQQGYGNMPPQGAFGTREEIRKA
ncbi:MAG TPA: c-type cytochrome, partial [Pseudohaliea sp.]|nr:c-type cytochrome [Pseudohaliea sp.]